MSRARDLGSSINSTAAGKNLIINGNFEISQRTATPETAAYTGGNTYVFDRWSPHQYQSSQVSRTSIAAGSGPSSRYALRVSTPSLAQDGGGSRVVIAQKVESINTYPLRGQRLTLSFWVRFSNSNFTSISNSTQSNYSNFSYSVSYNTTTTDAAIGSTGQDVYDTFTAISNTNSSGSLPTTWTKLTLNSTVPLNANNILVRFGFDQLGTSTSSGQYWYEIADVQLEKGSSATPFSLAGGDIQGELAKCQRYYYQTDSYATGSYSSYNSGNFVSSAFVFPVTMRIAPAISVTDIPGNANRMTQYPLGGSAVANITPPSAVNIRTTHWFYEAGGTSNGSQGTGGAFAVRYIASSEI